MPLVTGEHLAFSGTQNANYHLIVPSRKESGVRFWPGVIVLWGAAAMHLDRSHDMNRSQSGLLVSLPRADEGAELDLKPHISGRAR